MLLGKNHQQTSNAGVLLLGRNHQQKRESNCSAEDVTPQNAKRLLVILIEVQSWLEIETPGFGGFKDFFDDIFWID